MKHKLILPIAVLAIIAGVALAQQSTTSSSTSSSKQGSSSATAGGQASSRAAGSQTGTAQGGSQASAVKFVVTRPTHALIYSPNPVGAGNANVDHSNVWTDQREYYQRLAKEGKLLYAGPWSNANGAMVILNVESDALAHDIADNDPAVKGMLYVTQVRSWNVSLIGPGVVQVEKPSATPPRIGG